MEIQYILLHCKEYVELVKKTIQETINKYIKPGQNKETTEAEFCITDQLLFEMIKMEIRGQTIKFSSELKKKTMKKEKELEKEMNSLKIRFDTLCLKGDGEQLEKNKRS